MIVVVVLVCSSFDAFGNRMVELSAAIAIGIWMEYRIWVWINAAACILSVWISLVYVIQIADIGLP
jgi:hypothetical protein